MLNSVREIRIRDGKELYHLKLEIPEEEYFQIYNDIDSDIAKDILSQYLLRRQDDGRLENIQIKHDKKNHTVNLTTELHYLENDHTDF